MTRPCLAFVFALALVAGCQSRLSEQRTFTVDAARMKLFEIDGPKYDRTVTLTLTADQPVDLDVYLKRDADADRGPKAKLGALAKSSGGSLDVRVPAGEVFVIEVNAG